MFADNTKIFRKIQSKSDFLQFQQDINNLFTWSVKWQLKFNILKCFILHLGPDHSYGDYYLDGVQILPNTTVKDLGVTMDCYLNLMNTLISQLLRPTVFLALSAKLLTVENQI